MVVISFWPLTSNHDVVSRVLDFKHRIQEAVLRVFTACQVAVLET